jgi:hypothetical protein
LIRRALTDGEWQRVEALTPGKKGDKERHGADNRLLCCGWSGPERPGATCRIAVNFTDRTHSIVPSARQASAHPPGSCHAMVARGQPWNFRKWP